MSLQKVYILQHGLDALFMEAYFALYSIIAHEVAWRSINNVDIDMTMLQSKSETWLNVD